MSSPDQALEQLAKRLMKHLGGSAHPSDSAVAVEAACHRLRTELTETLGSGGASALIARALFRANRTHSVLDEVSVDATPGRCFVGLRESLASAADEDAEAAGAAILTQLFSLLVTFLGEDLGLQPVQKFWPEVANSFMGSEE